MSDNASDMPQGPDTDEQGLFMRVDGAEFRTRDQLSTTDRERLSKKGLKPIEIATLEDVRGCNRDHLRTYCVVYNMKKKEKAEMEMDMARYVAAWHHGEPGYDLATYMPSSGQNLQSSSSVRSAASPASASRPSRSSGGSPAEFLPPTPTTTTLDAPAVVDMALLNSAASRPTTRTHKRVRLTFSGKPDHGSVGGKPSPTSAAQSDAKAGEPEQTVTNTPPAAEAAPGAGAPAKKDSASVPSTPTAKKTPKKRVALNKATPASTPSPALDPAPKRLKLRDAPSSVPAAEAVSPPSTPTAAEVAPRSAASGAKAISPGASGADVVSLSTPAAQDVAPSAPAVPKVAPRTPAALKVAPSVPVAPKVAPSTPVPSEVAPSKPAAPKVAPSKTAEPKVALTALAAPKAAPSTPVAPKVAPSTPVAPKVAPSAPAAPKVAPSTPTAPKVAPSTPTAPMVAQSTPSGPKVAQNIPAAPKVVQSTPVAMKVAPSMPAGPKVAQSTLRAPDVAPSIPAAQNVSPSAPAQPSAPTIVNAPPAKPKPVYRMVQAPPPRVAAAQSMPSPAALAAAARTSFKQYAHARQASARYKAAYNGAGPAIVQVVENAAAYFESRSGGESTAEKKRSYERYQFNVDLLTEIFDGPPLVTRSDAGRTQATAQGAGNMGPIDEQRRDVDGDVIMGASPGKTSGLGPATKSVTGVVSSQIVDETPGGEPSTAEDRRKALTKGVMDRLAKRMVTRTDGDRLLELSQTESTFKELASRDDAIEKVNVRAFQKLERARTPEEVEKARKEFEEENSIRFVACPNRVIRRTLDKAVPLVDPPVNLRIIKFP